MTARRLLLRHPTGETPVVVAAGAMREFASEAEAWLAGRQTFVISSERIWDLHGDALEPWLEAASGWQRWDVPDGEAAKSLAVAERLWRGMSKAAGKRDSRVIAFGGGSVGDLAGFVAGCFLRGVSYLQLPTTLLSQVDAAIGGKTGINLPEAKNVVGLFYHPWAVVADTGLLATLPPAELRSGLFEVVKVAVILDARLFEEVENRLDQLLSGDPQALTPVVAAAVRAKLGIVEEDPLEQGRRRLLNFGHTLGHAIEARLGYASIRHGEAIGYGMLFASRLAARRELPAEAARRIQRLILRLGLPPLPRLAAEDLWSLIHRDKKARESGLSWVLPTRLGTGRSTPGIAEDELRRELESFLSRPLTLC